MQNNAPINYLHQWPTRITLKGWTHILDCCPFLNLNQSLHTRQNEVSPTSGPSTWVEHIKQFFLASETSSLFRSFSWSFPRLVVLHLDQGSILNGTKCNLELAFIKSGSPMSVVCPNPLAMPTWPCGSCCVNHFINKLVQLSFPPYLVCKACWLNFAGICFYWCE